MNLTISLTDCSPEAARKLVQLAKARASSAPINIEIPMSDQQAIALLQDDDLWHESVPNTLVPQLCKVLKAIEGGEGEAAIADLKRLLNIDS